MNLIDALLESTFRAAATPARRTSTGQTASSTPRGGANSTAKMRWQSGKLFEEFATPLKKIGLEQDELDTIQRAKYDASIIADVRSREASRALTHINDKLAKNISKIDDDDLDVIQRLQNELELDLPDEYRLKSPIESRQANKYVSSSSAELEVFDDEIREFVTEEFNKRVKAYIIANTVHIICEPDTELEALMQDSVVKITGDKVNIRIKKRTGNQGDR